VVSPKLKFIAITVDELILLPLAWALIYFFLPDYFVLSVVVGIVGATIFVAIKYYFLYPVLQDGSYKLYDLQGVTGVVIETVTNNSGKIKVGQEIWNAVTEFGELLPGAEIKIESRDSFTVSVYPLSRTEIV